MPRSQPARRLVSWIRERECALVEADALQNDALAALLFTFVGISPGSACIYYEPRVVKQGKFFDKGG